MPDSRPPLDRLDPASLNQIRRFGFQLIIVLMFAFAAGIGNSRSLAAGSLVLAGTCAFSSMLGLGRAVIKRHRFAFGPFNGWDEALAFAAVSRLAYFIAGNA